PLGDVLGDAAHADDDTTRVAHDVGPGVDPSDLTPGTFDRVFALVPLAGDERVLQRLGHFGPFVDVHQLEVGVERPLEAQGGHAVDPVQLRRHLEIARAGVPDPQPDMGQRLHLLQPLHALGEGGLRLQLLADVANNDRHSACQPVPGQRYDGQHYGHEHAVPAL